MNFSKALTVGALAVVGIVASAGSVLAGSNGIRFERFHGTSGTTSHQTVNFSGNTKKFSDFEVRTSISESGHDGIQFQKNVNSFETGGEVDHQSYNGVSTANSWSNTSSNGFNLNNSWND